MSSPNPDEITVHHNASANRFEARIGTELAVVDYLMVEERLVFTHTYVPAALRGHGIAEKLVRTALEYAQAEKLRIVPRCSYVAAFIERHKEFQGLG
ncbi:MAG: GNAT family N-acetyltransferase [Opitutaceae bacterium]